jgi:hypothetical protein
MNLALEFTSHAKINRNYGFIRLLPHWNCSIRKYICLANQFVQVAGLNCFCGMLAFQGMLVLE